MDKIGLGNTFADKKIGPHWEVKGEKRILPSSWECGKKENSDRGQNSPKGVGGEEIKNLQAHQQLWKGEGRGGGNMQVMTPRYCNHRK